jgi:hypothetical protein
LAETTGNYYCALTERKIQRTFICTQRNSSIVHVKGGDVMERRHFLKLAFGVVAGAGALAASAKAAPLPPVSAEGLLPPRGEAAEPAVVSQDDVDRLKPEEVRWGHHHGHRHRHWGWHRRHHWHRRHWGWHRHHGRRHRW